MSGEQELPPGFELVVDFDACEASVAAGGVWLRGPYRTVEDATAAAWRVYRAIELDVLRDLVRRDEADPNPYRTTWEILHERLAELEGGER